MIRSHTEVANGHGGVRERAGEGGHGHGHDEDRGRPGAFTAGESKQARRLGMVLALIGGFFVLELAGALAAQSVVLQADALHLLMDVFALAVSLIAMRLAVQRPTPRFTFGLRRAEPVAAIVSAGLVLLTTAGIVVEAVASLHEHSPPKAGLMLIVSVAALFVNGLSAWLLHDALAHSPGHAHDPDNPDDVVPPSRNHPHPRDHENTGGHALNLRGATLHLIGDTLGALAALVAAVAIRFGGPRLAWADPVASFVVAAILLVGSLRLLRDAALVLLEAAPPHLSVGSIRSVVAAFPGVEAVHDLHVWTLGAGHDAVTAHVQTRSRDVAFSGNLSSHLRKTLGVEYVTVQVEPCPDPVVVGRGGRTDA